MSACSVVEMLSASPLIKVIVPEVKLADGLIVISPAIKTPFASADTVVVSNTVLPEAIAVPSSITELATICKAPPLPPVSPISLPAASKTVVSPLVSISNVKAKIALLKLVFAPSLSVISVAAFVAVPIAPVIVSSPSVFALIIVPSSSAVKVIVPVNVWSEAASNSTVPAPVTITDSTALVAPSRSTLIAATSIFSIAVVAPTLFAKVVAISASILVSPFPSVPDPESTVPVTTTAVPEVFNSASPTLAAVKTIPSVAVIASARIAIESSSA